MFKITICLDNEMHAALMMDASRHLRPTIFHAKALLREKLGLPFPYPDGFDEARPETWQGAQLTGKVDGAKVIADVSG
jgi:hypothetical protein